MVVSCKTSQDGQDAHPTIVIFSCGVGVPPAQEFDEKECEQETP
jgi:hypothetical protein